jgi:hypothetical protein
MEYLVLDKMDEGDLLGFIHRLRKARELIRDAEWAGDEEFTQDNANNPDRPPAFSVEFKSPKGDENPFYLGDIQFALTSKGPNPPYNKLVLAENSGRRRVLSVSEYLRTDGTNLYARRDFQRGDSTLLLRRQIDRWLELASRPVWKSDDAYCRFYNDLWRTVSALIDAAGSDEIYDRMVARLALRTGGPYGPVELVPVNEKEDLYSVSQFLTEAGAAAFAKCLPRLICLQEERDERRNRYTLTALTVEESPQQATKRDAGNVIETMKRLADFAEVEGPVLVPGVRLSD